jgi:hypothetical protein
VTEARLWPRHFGADPAERAKRAVPGEAAERHQHARAVEQLEFALEVGEAVVALLRRRPVGRRRTAIHRGHEGVAKPQAVAPVHGVGLVGEPGAMQRGKQPIAGTVAGEEATGAVAAMRRRGQADDYDARGWIA